MGEEWMQIAIERAIRNVHSAGGPFAAVVVRNSIIVGEGTNLVTSTSDPTAHAEIVAIRDACRALRTFQLTDCELYSTSEPCPMCLGAIYWCRLSRVYFATSTTDAAHCGFDDALIYHELRLPPEARRVRMVQIMRERALDVFSAWQNKADKIAY